MRYEMFTPLLTSKGFRAGLMLGGWIEKVQNESVIWGWCRPKWDFLVVCVQIT